MARPRMAHSPGQSKRVRVKAMMPPGHVRAPAYLRGKTGEIERALGPFGNPERLAYEERKKRERESSEQSETDDDSEQAIKRNKPTPSQYYYRQHYLSIIQEEEEKGETSRHEEEILSFSFRRISTFFRLI